MYNSIKKKIISGSLMLALAATAVGGTLALTSDGGVNDAVNKVYSAYASAKEMSTGNVYYVSPDAVFSEGNDTTADGSKSNPYHIYDVLGYYVDATNYYNGKVTLAAGDTVILLSGVYNLDKKIQVYANGTYDNYITVKTEDGSANAVLSFYEMKFDSTCRGVQINADYWYWYGVNICGAGDNGMYISGNYNVVENCEFYNNRDTGLQLGRELSSDSDIAIWPNYNLIKNCSSYNNYDNETYGENADGFAAKLTVGYGNIFDGCIAYRNSDDGWDLYAKTDSGNIGAVIIYNCVAFENGYLMETQQTCNDRFPTFDETTFAEDNTNKYTTRDGDGNGFKLGGSVMEGEVLMYNCMSFNNRMHGVTDNSNPGTLVIQNVTSYNNGAAINNDSTSADFGKIDYSGSTESCNNIDVARQTYSYNVLSGILSVINGNTNTGVDVYRGSVENSLFDNGYKVEGAIDADTNYSDMKGTSYTQASADDIFTEFPDNGLGISDGAYSTDAQAYSNTIHQRYRNADGSINMGNILEIKDQSIISAGIGCVINEAEWDDYTHYDYTYLNECKDSDDALATAIQNMMYVPVNKDACYQDFQVVGKILGVSLEWTSSNPDVLEVTENVTTSYSYSQMIDVVVYRQSSDTTVTLTASVTVGSYTYTKDFEIIIKANDPDIGAIAVEGVEDDMIVIDQYKLMTEPTFTVENASDYNGKLLSEDDYVATMTYSHALDKNSTFVPVAGFTTSVPGIYEVTITVSLKNDSSKTNSYTYNIYVASTSTSVEFTDGASTLTVNKEGFLIEGEPSNITGKLYVLTTAADAATPTAETIIASGEENEFRSESIAMQFENANSAAYNVYYVLTDVSGDHVSEVYSKKVETVSISTTAEFEDMLANNVSTKIYLLTNDIDFNGAEVTTSSNSFVGLFNGMGYTIKNVKATRAIFQKVSGGTIQNVKFDNITITSTAEKSGIVGEMVSGYIYNVAITNIDITSSTNRMGAMIGQIIAPSDTTTTTYIERVSVVNDSDHDITGSQRIGGIVGFIQAGNSNGANRVTIVDCFVSSTITGTDYVGGIVGRSDDRNANDYLSISGCYTTGNFYDTQRLGGILGGFTGTGVTRISKCITTACLYFAGENSSEVATAQKNCSGMVGNYAANADMLVENCIAKFADHNSDYDVSTNAGNAYLASFWQQTSFDMENTWSYCDTDAAGNLVAPYVTLNFIEVE